MFEPKSLICCCSLDLRPTCQKLERINNDPITTNVFCVWQWPLWRTRRQGAGVTRASWCRRSTCRAPRGIDLWCWVSTDTQTDRQRDRNRKRNKQVKIDTECNRQIHRRAHGQIDRQGNRQIHRQTEAKTLISETQDNDGTNFIVPIEQCVIFSSKLLVCVIALQKIPWFIYIDVHIFGVDLEPLVHEECTQTSCKISSKPLQFELFFRRIWDPKISFVD